MKKLVLLFLLVFFVSFSSAAPSVDPIGVSLVDGSSFSITGSSFGIKSGDQNAPLVYLDFENCNDGDDSTCFGWSPHSSNDNDAEHQSRVTTSNARDTTLNKGFRMWDSCDTRDGGPGTEEVFDKDSVGLFYDESETKIYWDFWLYNNFHDALCSPTPDGNQHQIKYGRIWNNDNGPDEFPYLVRQYYHYISENIRVSRDPGSAWMIYGPTENTGIWNHYQIEVDLGPKGESQSRLKFYLNGNAIDEEFLYDESSTDPVWNVGGHVMNNPMLYFYYKESTACTPCYNPDLGYEYVIYDDVYFDRGLARIEIGNDPVYESSTHREIQIPVSWNEGLINFEANRGSFSEGEQLYLFVVDNNGDASNGVPVSFGDVAPSCTLTSAAWSTTTAEEGEQVTLTINGNNCDGKQLDFELFDTDDLILFTDLDPVLVTDPASTTFISGVATQTWTTEWVDDTDGTDSDPEYVFIASLNEDAGVNMQSSNTLKVSQGIVSLAGCGDNILNIGEQCDDGNLNENDGCNSDCEFAVPTNGQVHWVDENNPGCNDGGDGMGNPWCTIRPIDSHTFVPGDSVVLRAGDYDYYGRDRSGFGVYDDSDVTITDSGTSANPIVIMSYPGETVILRDEVGGSSGFGYAVIGSKGDYVIIQGLTIIGQMRLSDPADYNIIRSNEFYGLIGDYGAYTTNYAALMPFHTSYNLIRNNYFQDYVRGGEFSGNNAAIQMWDYESDGYNIIENNEIVNCQRSIYGKDNLRFNIIRKNKIDDGRYGVFIASQCEFGTGCHDNEIYQNLITGTTRAIEGEASSPRNTVRNNVFMGGRIENKETSETEFEIYDNIFVPSGNAVYRTGSTVAADNPVLPTYMNYNMFDPSFTYAERLSTSGTTTYSSLSSWRSAGFDVNSIEGDPLFVDEHYHLNPSSLARGAGRYGGDLGLYPDGDETVVIGRSLPDIVPPATYCGDGGIQSPNDDGINEVCDGINFGGQTCTDFGFDSGSLSCINNCQTIDTSNCESTPSCLIDDDCNHLDDLPCTEGVCNAGTCEISYTTNTCNDNNACTINDVCSLGVCGGTSVGCINDDGCCPVGCTELTDNDCSIVTDDAIIYLPLSTDYQDHSLNNYPVSCTSCPTNIARGYGFDGISNYLDLGDQELTLPLTLMSWVKLNDKTVHNSIIQTDDSIDYSGAWLQVTSSDVIRAGFGDNLGAVSANKRQALASGAPLVQGEWHHLATSIVDANNINIYIDGSLVSSSLDGSNTGMVTSVDSFTVGKREVYGPDYASVDLEEVRVYDRALNAQEIVDAMNGVISITCTDNDGDNYFVESSGCDAQPGFLGHDDCDDSLTGALIYPGSPNCVDKFTDSDCDGIPDYGSDDGSTIIIGDEDCMVQVTDIELLIPNPMFGDDVFVVCESNVPSDALDAGINTINDEDECDWINQITNRKHRFNCKNQIVSSGMYDALCYVDPDVDYQFGFHQLTPVTVEDPAGTLVSQTINLNSGWNVVSINISNPGLSSDDFDSMYVMRYHNGWESDWNGISGDEFALESLRGYYVYSTSTKTLTFTGTSVTSEYSLVDNTWNLFSVNNTIVGNGFSVEVIGGSFVYNPVTSFTPGMHYWIAVGDVLFGPPFYEGVSFDSFNDWFEWLFSS